MLIKTFLNLDREICLYFDTEISLEELNMALDNTGYSSPGCDNICND